MSAAKNVGHGLSVAAAAVMIALTLESSNSGYLAGRKETWIWTATPGALKPRMSLAV
jgi:hypothetical protein